MLNLNKLELFKPKRLAVIVAGITAILLSMFKFIVGLLGGSVSVMSSTLDSMIDCLVLFLNFFAFKKSSDVSNDKFNYKYQKLQALSSSFEGLLVVCIVLFILYDSIKKFFILTYGFDIDMALYVVLFSFFITGVLFLIKDSFYILLDVLLDSDITKRVVHTIVFTQEISNFHYLKSMEK